MSRAVSADPSDLFCVPPPDFKIRCDTQLMQQVYDQGHDTAAITRRLITATPLNELPAQDLRYRLVAHLDLGVDPHPNPVDTPAAKTTTHPGLHRKARASTVTTTPTPPR
jgi:hypothetical protein